MKLSKLLEGEGLSLSFEVFPPKTDSNFEGVKPPSSELSVISNKTGSSESK